MTRTRYLALGAALTCAMVLTAGAWAYPTVFPVGVTIHEEGVGEGYLLFRGQGGGVYLVDSDGAIVHNWTFPCGAGGAIKGVENGHVLAKSCENIVEVDWDSNVVFEFPVPEGVEFHHDWDRLPNGNTLILSRRVINDPSISQLDFREDFILEVTPGGEVVWEWHEADHFDEFGFPQERLDRIYERGNDWSHANTVAAIPENTSHNDPRFQPGNIIISLRHQNTIAVIDHVTGEVVWVMTDRTIGQHTTHMIPDGFPGAGNILVFDNGWAGDWSAVNNKWRSRVVEINPIDRSFPYIYIDEDSGRVRGSFFSFAVAGAQRLENGNTLITEGRAGRVFEVNEDKEIIWEYIVPFWNNAGSNHVYRATKMPVAWAAPFFTPQLAVSGSAAPDPVVAGETLGYSIQVDNLGSEPAINVELTQMTPDGATFRSITAPLGWSCTAPPVGGTGLISCTTASLGAGVTADLSLVVESECGTALSEISHTAEVTTEGNDAVPDDNEVTIVTTVIPADCAVCGDGIVNAGDLSTVELLVDGGFENWSAGKPVAWKTSDNGGAVIQSTVAPFEGNSSLGLLPASDGLLRAFQEFRGLTPGGAYELRLWSMTTGGADARTPRAKLVNVTRQEWLDTNGDWQPVISDALLGGQTANGIWQASGASFATSVNHDVGDLYRLVVQYRGSSDDLFYDGVRLFSFVGEGEQCDDGNDVDDDACSNDCTENFGWAATSRRID